MDRVLREAPEGYHSGVSMTREFNICLPFRTVTESNANGHWRTKARRARAQRGGTKLVVAANLGGRNLWPPIVVTFTRISPGTLDDDNLSSSMKHVRDGIADAFGIDDRDPRVSWKYEQRKESSYGVEIRIEGAEDGDVDRIQRGAIIIAESMRRYEKTR